MRTLLAAGMTPRRFLSVCFFGMVMALALTGQAAAQSFNEKNPVVGAGCMTCSWGVTAEFIRQALKREGKDIRICYNCNRDPSPLIVAERRRPPALIEQDIKHGVTTRLDEPVDFGITNMERAEWVYQGTYNYSANGPHPSMRAIGFIEAPNYLVFAVHAESGIQSLDELKSRKGLRISIRMQAFLQAVLDYYGLTADVMKANGDILVPEETESADLIVSSTVTYAASIEAHFWPAVTEKYKLRFLPLAEPLRAKLAKDFPLLPVVMPLGYMPGIDAPVPTVARRGHLIFGRDDMPEQYGYDLARALDVHQDLLPYMAIPLYYNNRTVTRTGVIPLHPGAARYYREVGYLK